MLQRVKLRRQRARRGLQQSGKINVIGAKAQAERPQLGAAFLIERLHVLRDAGAVEHAKLLTSLIGDAARHPGEIGRILECEQRAEQLLDFRRDPQVETLVDLLSRG